MSSEDSTRQRGCQEKCSMQARASKANRSSRMAAASSVPSAWAPLSPKHSDGPMRWSSQSIGMEGSIGAISAIARSRASRRGAEASRAMSAAPLPPWDFPAPHVVTLEVLPADIDAYDHVNNAVYLAWFDRAAWSH